MTFRLKLLLAMMLLVVGVTATTLLITENQVRASYERHFQQSFQSQVDSFLRQREFRLEPVKQKIAAAAASTRLLAAMENVRQTHPDPKDIDDVYQNGLDELSDIVKTYGAGADNLSRGFFVFLNEKSEALLPSPAVKLPYPLEIIRELSTQLEALSPALLTNGTPQVGYVAPATGSRTNRIHEALFVPITDEVTHQRLGVLVAGFPLANATEQGSMLSAVWLHGRLYATALTGEALKNVEEALSSELRDNAPAQRDFQALVAGLPYRVFCQSLRAGPGFPPAYQVCLFSLAEAAAENQQLSRKILLSGIFASLLALVLSWVISRGLAVPLKELVVGTMQIERGEYGVKVPVRGKDELGLLGRAFNSMAERIQTSYAALEQRIAERTQELAERKRAEEALRQSEASLREAQRIAHLGNWDWNVATDELRWSDELYSIFGLEKQDFKGTFAAFLERVHPADRNRVESGVRQSLEAGTAYSLEHRVLRRDGEIRIVRAQGEMSRAAAGKPTHMLGTLQDITEQKRIEAEFLRAQRMDSIGALAGGMAHDLNNALSPILMGVQLMRRKTVDAETQQMLKVIETNTHRGAGMVRQVLTFARGREGDRELLDLSRLLREMESIARQTLPRTIIVSAMTPPDLWPVFGNSTQLHQILLNLCINARDAMPKGGQLTLAADNVELTATEAATMPDAAAGNFVMLLVSDTGTGISPENLPKLFQPFFTTKNPGEGTGLGLSTVARIVRNHGGFFSVKSDLGEGSTFEIYFPRAKTDAAPAPRAAPSQLPNGHGEMILLIEDDRSVREMAAASLGEYGYQVVSAGSGTDAAGQLGKYAAKLNLVLTIPMLGAVNTVELTRKHCPEIPVILMSGELEASGNGSANGTTAYLGKPFSLEQLLMTVAKQLRRPE
jgi:two-component system cell cycle sensor histidine kinase/response regulator CckA